MAAAGGSYGGYMADWIATHTGRFKAIISHAGVSDKLSMYGATEELWFEEHDMKGTPWTSPEAYRKWSPLTYADSLQRFKTPTLVIAGEQDYRVPYTQSLEFYTALQRNGVPSKLMIFPDEGHWINKPQNAELWYKTFAGLAGGVPEIVGCPTDLPADRRCAASCRSGSRTDRACRITSGLSALSLLRP